jgi:hypothetical protein
LAKRIVDCGSATLRQSDQVELISLRRVNDRLEIAQTNLRRELFAGIREPHTPPVVENQATPLSEDLPESPCSGPGPLVLEVREPTECANDCRALTDRRPRDVDSIDRLTEAELRRPGRLGRWRHRRGGFRAGPRFADEFDVGLQLVAHAANGPQEIVPANRLSRQTGQPLQRPFGDDDVGPQGANDFILGEDPLSVLAQEPQKRPHFRLHIDLLAGTHKGVPVTVQRTICKSKFHAVILEHRSPEGSYRDPEASRERELLDVLCWLRRV